MSSPSLVIRNGTIVDGSGGDPYEADLAVDRRQDRGDRRQHCQGRRGDRRARQACHAGLRRRAHALRRAGDLERPAVAVVLERRHDRAVRQLRRRLRALPRRPARHADQPDGGRGGHSRGRADRGPAVELAQLPRLPRCDRRPLLRRRCRRPGAACRAARLCDGRARRQPRAGHRAGPPAHGRAHGRGPARRRARLLDLAHAQPPRRRRHAHPDLARRGGGADGDRPCHARGRHRLDADRVGLRGPGGRDRPVPPAGAGVQPARHHLAAAVRCPARRLAHADGARSTRPMPRVCASPPRCARGRPACCSGSSCRRTRSWAGRATRRSPICRSRERLAELRQPEFRARLLAEAFEGGRRASAGSTAGIACSRSAIRRTTSRSPRAASPRARRAKAATPEEVAYDLLLEARRHEHALPAGHQLRRRQPRRGARDDRRAQHADRPGRRRRACRHHVRRHRHQLHADPLDARSRPRRRCSRCRGRIKRLAADNAAAIGLDDRGLLRGRHEGRHQRPGLRQPAPAPRPRSSTTCRPAASGWSSAPTASTRPSSRAPSSIATARRPAHCRAG